METTLKAPVLFIPGPTQVSARILEAQAQPMIGHRSGSMKELLADCLPGVRECFGTRGDVVILTCSSTAAMESVSRSVVRPGRRVLHLVNGNFANLWLKLSQACGADAVAEVKEWGEGFDEDSTLRALQDHGAVDAVMVTHCETSCGVLSDLAGVVRAVRSAQPDALVCADVTSSACGTEVAFDEIDLDLAVGGVQKAWALPPGIALAAVSSRARARFEEVPNRGHVHDFVANLEFQDARSMTLTTPAIPVMQSLREQIRTIQDAGGFSQRYDDHRQMQKMVLDWTRAREFPVLAAAGFESPTVTSIACDGRFAIPDLLQAYQQAGFTVGGGYGKTKVTHWRIGHMGDHTPEEVARLLEVTDQFLARG